MPIRAIRIIRGCASSMFLGKLIRISVSRIPPAEQSGVEMATLLSRNDKLTTDNLDLLLNVATATRTRRLKRRRQYRVAHRGGVGPRSSARSSIPGHAAYLTDSLVTREELQYVASRVGNFTRDNRAGIERTLHRISAMRNRLGEIVGLTCRVGRAHLRNRRHNPRHRRIRQEHSADGEAGRGQDYSAP